MTDLPVPSQPDLVLHMPCGCPYPKIGDHRPCEHGNNAYDDDVPSQPDRPRDCHWPDCKDSGACDFRGHRCAPSQPDRDTAFTAWSADLPFTWGFEETAFAAGWDAATRAERERIRQLAIDKGATFYASNVVVDGRTFGRYEAVPFADLLGGDTHQHDPPQTP